MGDSSAFYSVFLLVFSFPGGGFTSITRTMPGDVGNFLVTRARVLNR